jgi:hypothetical protein
MSPSIELSSAILSVNRALWGEVSPHLRSVQVTFDALEIRVFLYFDGPISEEDKEIASIVTTSVAADFPEHSVVEHCLQLDHPQPVPVVEGRHVVFFRREG